MIICRPFITLRNGRKLYAHEVGKKAFCWEVSPEKEEAYKQKQAEKAKKKGK